MLSSDGKEIYFMGVIDILQLYNMRKRSETVMKSMFVRREELSSVDAISYGDRFIQFMTDVSSNGGKIFLYITRNLQFLQVSMRTSLDYHRIADAPHPEAEQQPRTDFSGWRFTK